MSFPPPFSNAFHAQMKEISFSDIFLTGMDTLRFVGRWDFFKKYFLSKAMFLKKDANFQRDI